MHVESLQKFFASSPAVRLIRSPHAYWIVDFLHAQFKLAGQITRRHSELAAELELYLNQLSQNQALQADSRPKSQDQQAETYLASWCSSSIGWLKRFIDDQASEPSYQLTAEFEKALAFVQRASQDVTFVGTESRLRTILDVLNSIVAGSAEDPRVRERELEARKQAIERELAHLKQTPQASRLTDTQIRERFALATQQLQQLKSEFRAVEDRFKAITRKVQQKILSAEESRGDILQFALDSEDMLKQGDQGQSFFEFLKLLHSPSGQDRIARLVHGLGELEALASQHESLESLRTMVPTLIAEAEKILRTTQHLSITLRRLLDSRSTQHHQQLSKVLRDILSAAADRAENPPTDIGMDVEVELEIQSAMDRPFWEATQPFDEVELATADVDPQQQARAVAQLVALERMDWDTLRRNITTLTARDQSVSLAELLDKYPLRLGAIELLGYLQIAFDDGHRIDRNLTTLIAASPANPGGFRIPQVVFLPEQQRVATSTGNRPLEQLSESMADAGVSLSAGPGAKHD